jgi:hypothetical protein
MGGYFGEHGCDVIVGFYFGLLISRRHTFKVRDHVDERADCFIVPTIFVPPSSALSI